MPGIVNPLGQMTVVFVKAGIPTDADFPATPPEGTLAYDTTNNRIYVRDGAGWRYVATT